MYRLYRNGVPVKGLIYRAKLSAVKAAAKLGLKFRRVS